jgi:hypothetical protein
MRNLFVNGRTLWYALYKGKTDAVDENGDYTGEPTFSYAEPVKFRATLSPVRGGNNFTNAGLKKDAFGADLDYARIMSTTDRSLPIDEYSLIWTKTPATLPDGSTDFSSADYRVVAVADGLYHGKYALRYLKENLEF